MSQERLAITGSGLVCCLGSGSDEVYRRLCAGECGIRPIDRFPAEAYPQGQAGQIPSAVERSRGVASGGPCAGRFGCPHGAGPGDQLWPDGGPGVVLA